MYIWGCKERLKVWTQTSHHHTYIAVANLLKSSAQVMGIVRSGTDMCYLPKAFCIYTTPFPPNGVIKQVDFS